MLTQLNKSGPNGKSQSFYKKPQATQNNMKKKKNITPHNLSNHLGDRKVDPLAQILHSLQV